MFGDLGIIHFLQKITKTVTSEAELTRSSTKVLSLFFISIAFVITLMPYPGGSFLVFISLPPVYIRPDLISASFGLALLTPIYARGILNWKRSIYGILMFILFWSVFSSLVQVGLNGSVSSLPKYLIGAAILISWFGIRGLASTGWILALGAAIINLINTNDALGLWGFVFICCSFLGLLLHTNLSPATLINALLDEYRPSISKGEDVLEGKPKT